MIPKNTCGLCLRFFAVLAFVVCVVSRSAAIELSIIESGPDSDAKVGLWARDLRSNSISGVTQITSPTGDVFTSETALGGDRFNSLLKRFDSISDAFDYVQGTWQGLAPLWPPFPPATGPFEFSIGDVSADTLNRTVPTLLSPAPGAGIKNGSTFLHGWDYLSAGEAPRRTSITVVPQFDPLSSWGRSIVSTPTPGGTTRSSSSTGSGDRLFSTTRTNVPGTDKNRFLASFTAAEAALPLDIELTMGSYFSLDTALTISYSPGTGFFSPPNVSFFYSRQLDPFRITLTRVPEPSSIGLLLVSLVGISLRRSCRIRQKVSR